ncbi:hypothetical protein Tco_0857783 [Tanacetum coccineum]|uniref:Uncharacterized protein n=1 Tax=Tanacetum coccineum TaxID=301880 RepID=A0ABQ5BB56_9ASTR
MFSLVWIMPPKVMTRSAGRPAATPRGRRTGRRVGRGGRRVALCKCSSTGRLLGAYDLRVATPRALVHAGDKISGDARSWYMISGDAKSWVEIVFAYIHCHIAQLSTD